MHAQIKWMSERRHPNIVDTYTLEYSLNSQITVLINTHSTIKARTYTSLGIQFATPVIMEKMTVFCLKDRISIRYGVVKPLHSIFKRTRILLVKSVLDIGDVLRLVTGRSFLHSLLKISVRQMFRHLPPHIERITHLKEQ